MDEPIVFIGESRVRPGQLGSTPTIVHAFADEAGLAAHLEGSAQRSGAASEFIQLVRLTVYGTASPESLAALQASSGVPVDVRPTYVAGFLRASPGPGSRA